MTSLHYPNLSILQYDVIMLGYHNFIPLHHGNVIMLM